MEVLSGGFWGPVCDFWWGQQNANVFCRQLGYDGALAVSGYEQQNSEICLDVECIGNESSILGCRNTGWTSDKFVTSALCSPAGISFYVSHSIRCTNKIVAIIYGDYNAIFSDDDDDDVDVDDDGDDNKVNTLYRYLLTSNRLP